MTTYTDTGNFRHDREGFSAIVLVNLGTTASPDKDAVRRYLAEFLWDPRVVEMARPLWWLILHGVILRLRPGRVARAYQSIWTEQGSPLLAISQRLTDALQQRLTSQIGQGVEVALAMRYGQPSIERVLEKLRDRGMRRLLVVPMYPQYSATTTASVFDEVTRVLGAWRWIPELRFIQHYHDHPQYIAALADSVRAHWREKERPEKLLMSFHGIPKRYFRAGDPYYCECRKTARLLADALDLNEEQWEVAFQSRVGREEWLKPYTDKTLVAWGKQKLRSVDVICPGFSVDCLETLEEIQQQNRELFEARGGGAYSYIPALNDSGGQLDLLTALATTHLHGWPGATDAADDSPQEVLERARALGAQQ
jgi:ferrochelatase